MKNVSLSALLAVITLAALCSCNSSSGTASLPANENGGSPASGTKYLARNIILNAIPASPAYAQTDTVDTQTQILASNVIVEPMAASQIASNNVQDALKEISLKLPEVMVGTWNIQNYNQETAHQDTGNITIKSDGTFTLTAGSFAAIGMGSATGQDPITGLCKHTTENQTYQVFTDELLLFVHYNPGSNAPTGLIPPIKNAVIPRLVRLRQNEIIFVGEGGCGATGL